MRVVMTFDIPVVSLREQNATATLQSLVQRVADKLRRGATVEELCRYPPIDPNRQIGVLIERLDVGDEEDWTPERIDRFLDELDRQKRGE
jgi:hypothetical protein